MDNFEYSIHISDRDWEEFYSTAEECDLMQVSLAKEEELLLSDTEQEDATCSTTTSKSKFIRVSLCPSVGIYREPQTMQLSMPTPRHSTYKWIGSSDDVLSGSEDEEEFGSVARFLCQKETLLLNKVEREHRIDIPSSKTKDNYAANVNIEQLQESPVNESLVECMRAMNMSRKHHYERDKEDIETKRTEKTNHFVTSNQKPERRLPNDRHSSSLATDDPSRTRTQLLHLKDSPNISNDYQSCIMAKGPSVPEGLLNGNIPGFNNTIEDTKMFYLQSPTTLKASLEKQLFAENKIDDSTNLNSTLHNWTLDNPISSNNLPHTNAVEHKKQDCALLFSSKPPRDSSAVQQNIPAYQVEYLDSSNTKLNKKEPDTKVPVNSHELMFDKCRLLRAEGTKPVYSMVPAAISKNIMSSRNLLTQHGSLSYRNTALTLPEMYDFFFDDVSESIIIETGTNMASQEAIHEAVVYTPDMYEYFFVEDENTIQMKDHKPRESSDIDEHASSPSVVASWPEVCEFFFADGPPDQDRKGILYSIPSSQAQGTTNIFKSIVPKGLKECTVRRAFHSKDGKLIPYENYGTSEKTNVPTTGSVVPYLSPSRSDACLVFLALASWAVKSSDLQSSDGWKTAVLANIGAISAIRYLRRRRGTLQGLSLDPLEET